MTTAKKLPDVFVRSLQRAIAEAEHPVGMSPHDGKARVDASHLRRVLGQIATLEAQRDAAIRQVEAAERDARCYRSALVDVRMSLHAAGRRPETCYEMSTIDNALAQQSSGEKP